MLRATLFLFSIVMLTACQKNTYHNSTPDPKPEPKKTPAYSARYQLYDSLYFWSSNASGYTETKKYTPANAIIDIYIDSTANYIIANKDTFRYYDGKKAYGYKGYAIVAYNPMEYNEVRVTYDSIRFNRSYQSAGHSHTSHIAFGYKIK